MGQAFQEPRSEQSFYYFHYHITLHAVQRFRERADRATRPKTDNDLARALDERIHEAIHTGRVTEVVDRDDPGVNTKIVAIENREGPNLHVVMRMFRPNSYGRCVAGPPGIALGAVTILTQDMAAQSYATGRWFVAEKAPTTQASPFTEPGFKNTALADKLAGVTPTPPAPVVAPPAPPASEPEEERDGLGGTRQERIEFMREWLKTHPDGTWAEGSAAMKAEFGAGCSTRFFATLKAGKPTTRNPGAQGARTPTTPSDSVNTTRDIALQLAQSIETEKAARARLEAAQVELAAATKRSAELLEQLQAQRAG